MASLTLVTFSSNLSNFERYPPPPKKNQTIFKNPKMAKKKSKYTKYTKNTRKIQKIQKIPEEINKSINKNKKKIVKKFKNLKKSQKSNFFSSFLSGKKIYPLCYPILGGFDSTRALQSGPFQKYENLLKNL